MRHHGRRDTSYTTRSKIHDIEMADMWRYVAPPCPVFAHLFYFLFAILCLGGYVLHISTAIFSEGSDSGHAALTSQ